MLQVEKKNYIVAIDLGSQNVTAAAATRGADGKMVVEAVVRKPSGGVAGGAIENIDLAVKSLKEVVSELGEQLNIRVLEAYFGISGDFIRCACHNDWVSVGDHNNGVSKSDVDELYARMEKVSAPTDDEIILERIPQNFMVDGNKEVPNPVGSFGQSLSSTFNFILSTKTPIERLKKAAINLGIRPLGVYINPLVTAETLLLPDEKEEGVAVIDMGSNVTDVTIYYNNVIRYVASIPMGANTINLDIRAQSIPEKVVEKIKVRFGSAMAANVDEGVMIDYRTPKGKKGILQRNLATVIQARVQDMADMVVEEIKFAGYEKKLPYGIVLTGGGANLADIAEAFTEHTKIDTRIGVPDVVVDEQSADLVDGPEFRNDRRSVVARYGVGCGVQFRSASAGTTTHSIDTARAADATRAASYYDAIATCTARSVQAEPADSSIGTCTAAARAIQVCTDLSTEHCNAAHSRNCARVCNATR